MKLQSRPARTTNFLSLTLLLEALYVLYAFNQAGMFECFYVQQGVRTFPTSTLLVFDVISFFSIHGWFWLYGLFVGAGVCLRLAYRRCKLASGTKLLIATAAMLALLAVFINIALFQPFVSAIRPSPFRIVPVVFATRPA